MTPFVIGWPASIRGRFLLTTGFSFLVMIGSGVTHLSMVEVAREAASLARARQEQSDIYVRLALTARELQDATLAPDQMTWTGARYTDVRARFRTLLRNAAATSRRTGDPPAAAARIERAGANLLALADDHDRLIAALRRVVRGVPGGYRAEVTRSFAPFFDFDRLIQQETDAVHRSAATALARADGLTGRLATLSVISLLAGIWMMATAAYLILRRLREGLRQLETGASAIAAGDLDHRFSLGGGDELTRLAFAFDAMTTELGDKQRLIDAAQDRLEEAVRLRTIDLEEANRELALVDGRRRAFLAEIGHELRTPLTIMRGVAQVWLRSADRVPTDPAPAFGRILDQIRTMTRLVDDLFVISRAEAGGLTLQLQPVDLSAFIQEIIEDFATIAEERGCTLDFSAGEGAFAAVDPDRLRQILVIFLDNATIHGGPGPILVSLRRDRDDVEIMVADEGPGIPEATRDRLFMRFSRSGVSGGSGLGLSVAKALVQAHGGSVRLKRSCRQGACFAIRLPGDALQEGARA